MKVSSWEAKYKEWMDVFRKWINSDKDNILTQLNQKIFEEDWNKYADGNLSSWEMESLCFYYHEHELAHVNKDDYGIVNFYDLNPQPAIDRSFEKGGKTIKLYKLFKICGTCISKNKTKSIVTLLTPDGVVNVKFRKEHFTLFDKQLSERDASGTKKVIEPSWFTRGQMIVVNGMRSGDDFIVKKYASTPGHQLYRINYVDEDGSLELQSERYNGEHIE